MKFFKSFFKKLEINKTEDFWKDPDRFFIFIRLGDKGESVTGRLKGDYALIEQIPEPESGYFYKDQVKVKGPIGLRFFRDDEIAEYQAIALFKRTKIQTFTFEGIISNSKDYFDLREAFFKIGQAVEFPFPHDNRKFEWQRGLCVGQNHEQVSRVLDEYSRRGKHRKIKGLKLWTEDHPD